MAEIRFDGGHYNIWNTSAMHFTNGVCENCQKHCSVLKFSDLMICEKCLGKMLKDAIVFRKRLNLDSGENNGD